MRIPTFVINLDRAKNRKEYMRRLLDKHDFLEVEFVTAVDGKELPENDINIYFNEKLAYDRYGRTLNRGEIGCTLSHINCYKRIVENSVNVSLILEDDISILRDISVLSSLTPLLDRLEPTIMLLSGDFWYICRECKQNNLNIVKVYDAVGAYAYLINNSAAKLILKKYSIPSHVADHWLLYKRLGIKIMAVAPYLIDANIGGMESTIKQDFFGEDRSQMKLYYVVQAYWHAVIKRILIRFNRFVSKIRK